MRSTGAKSIASLCAAIALLSAAATAHAYHLPPYRMTADERSTRAEQVLEGYQGRLDEIAVVVPLGYADNRRKDYKNRLSPKAKRMLKGYDDLRDAHRFWSYVVSLKGDLLSLEGSDVGKSVEVEADAMAKAIIQVIYDLSSKYEIAFSPLVNNTLINLGFKERGFCYHYVNDIRNALKKYSWRHFDLRWGEAWPKTYFENNALIVTVKGKPFETGIAIDVWRKGGEPFWTPVEGDNYPWQEIFDVEKNYVVE